MGRRILRVDRRALQVNRQVLRMDKRIAGRVPRVKKSTTGRETSTPITMIGQTSTMGDQTSFARSMSDKTGSAIIITLD